MSNRKSNQLACWQPSAANTRWLVAIIMFNVLPIVCGVLCVSLFCCELLCVLSSFAIALKRKRELINLFLLSYGCLVSVNTL